MTIRPVAIGVGDLCRVHHDDSTDGVWAWEVTGPDESSGAVWIPAGEGQPPMMYLGPSEEPLAELLLALVLGVQQQTSLVLSESRILTVPRHSLVPHD